MVGNVKELEAFKSEYLLDKQEILTSMKGYILHCMGTREESWSKPKRRAVIRLLQDFYKQIEEMEDFQATKDWEFFEYNLIGTGVCLERWECTDIELDDKDELASMDAVRLDVVAFLECNYLSVSEFASRHEVSDTTVRQWIRRGKIRHAKKQGRDWFISELTDYPSRGYEPATYLWTGTLEGEEFQELIGYHQIYICQDRCDKQLFKGILGRFEGQEPKVLELSVREREKLELALISRDDVKVVELDDEITFQASKYEDDYYEEIAEEAAVSLPYGPVVVTKGRHKGRIGYLDDEDGAYGYVYWGDMLLSLDHYEQIPLSFLNSEISTNQILRRNYELKNKIAYMRACTRPNYKETTQLLTELLFVEQMLTERYYEVAFLKPQREIKVFLCYSREDGSYAKTLATDLTAKGYEVFLEEWSIDVGDSILSEIEKGLAAARVFIPIISKDFLSSAFCKEQWQAFYYGNRDKTGTIIPIVLDDSEVPPMLSGHKCIRKEGFGSSYEEVLLAILKKLRKETECE